MEEKTVLVVGGVIVAGVIVAMLVRGSQQTQLQQQALALQAQQSTTPAAQVGSVLSSVGGFFNSGAFGNLFSSFGATAGANNDPGLNDATDYTNDPGLEEGYD